jgi:molecular chaperone HscA
MALFQIAEPGESADRTSINSPSASISVPPIRWWPRCATVLPICLSDEQGRRCCRRWCIITPTVRPKSAQCAEAQAVDPKNTIISVKRFMGRGQIDVAHVESMPYDFVDAAGHGQAAHRRGYQESGRGFGGDSERR